MARILLLNKPFQVMSQFRSVDDKRTLAEFIDDPDLRVAGRLDYDSEGLLVLSDDGRMVQKITGSQAPADAIPAPWLNGLLGGIFRFERHLIGRVPMPFGLSLYAVVTRP